MTNCAGAGTSWAKSKEGEVDCGAKGRVVKCDNRCDGGKVVSFVEGLFVEIEDGMLLTTGKNKD